VLAFDDIVATPAPGFTPVRTDAEDAACLIYTSGTTGDPKGVLHAHRFLYGHLPCLELSLGWFPQPGDVGWTPADWAWIGGLMDMALPCLFYGVPLVSHRFAKFDPEAAHAADGREGVSDRLHPAHGAAPDAASQGAEGPAPARHRLGRGGAGRRPARLGSGALGCSINEFYGQTECNLVVASVDRVMARVPGAMGLPVPGHEVAVLGPGTCRSGRERWVRSASARPTR
jgi:acetyl-CoA synthetase